MENNEEEVPNYFNDPYEKYCEEMTQRARRLAKEFNEDQTDALAFAEVFSAHVNEAKENREMEVPSWREMMEGHVLRIECIGYKILNELKKLNGEKK